MRSRRASALLTALLTIAALSVLVMSFIYEAHQHGGLNLYVRERNRVLRLVDAGQAIAEIVMTKYSEAPEWSESQDLGKMLDEDRWILEKQDLKTSGMCKIGPILLDDTIGDDGQFENPATVTVEIGSSNDDKINVNTLWKGGGDDKYMERWWMIFQDHGIPEFLSTETEGRIELYNILIASWDDWRDEDDAASIIDGKDCGAEAKWYEEFEKKAGLDDDECREYRRRPRNGPIPDVHELENVRGFREYPAILTGGVINPWERREEDRITVRGILDVLSADGPAKINVNTCRNVSVLITVPGIYERPEDDSSLEESRQIAQRVVEGLGVEPKTRAYDKDRKWWPYKDWADLTARLADILDTQSGINPVAGNYIDYKTDQFKVRITGESRGMKHTVEAKCYVKDGKVRYYEWCENPVEAPESGELGR